MRGAGANLQGFCVDSAATFHLLARSNNIVVEMIPGTIKFSLAAHRRVLVPEAVVYKRRVVSMNMSCSE